MSLLFSWGQVGSMFHLIFVWSSLVLRTKPVCYISLHCLSCVLVCSKASQKGLNMTFPFISINKSLSHGKNLYSLQKYIFIIASCPSFYGTKLSNESLLSEKATWYLLMKLIQTNQINPNIRTLDNRKNLIYKISGLKWSFPSTCLPFRSRDGMTRGRRERSLGGSEWLPPKLLGPPLAAKCLYEW